MTPEDREALCYFWCQNGDITKDPKTHQMLVHMFGTKFFTECSGLCSQEDGTGQKNKISLRKSLMSY